MKRILLIALGVLFIFGLIASTALFTGGGVRGNWNTLEQSLRAEGLEPEWARIIPSASRDEENYFAHPVVGAWIPPKGGARRNEDSREQNGRLVPPELPRFITNTAVPYPVEWLASLPTSGPEPITLEKLEQWFARYDQGLAGLREAAKRPHAVWDANYADPMAMPIPDFPSMRLLSQIICTRAPAPRARAAASGH
ncbi:MAG TPA: hypothetical protein VEH27_15170 [Methylomirabilota bacterium]|nr:hypothetical protein [Methylomirabilota bacterium]